MAKQKEDYSTMILKFVEWAKEVAEEKAAALKKDRPTMTLREHPEEFTAGYREGIRQGFMEAARMFKFHGIDFSPGAMTDAVREVRRNRGCKG